MGRKQFSADFQLMFRLLKLFLFIGAIVALGLMFTLLSLTVGDIFASLLAFLPTAWAVIQVCVKWLLCLALVFLVSFDHAEYTLDFNLCPIHI